MTPLLRLLLLLLLLITPISAQSGPGPSDTQTSFRPSVAVVIGIFSIMFSLTFLLLMYAKFCHSVAYDFFNRGGGADPAAVTFAPGGPHRTLSGMDKAVIESLPFFRFSNLKGSCRGLECAVCLSIFDDAEVLRLLPKCKHAFHIGCVDKWLESHSTCPLCRHRVDPQDANPFNYSTSTRFLLNSDSEGRRSRDLELELFVEREPDDVDQIGSARKNDDVPISNEMHKFKHKIIVSDVVFKSRWSDLNSSDLVSLSSDMLNVASSKRFTKRLADNKESEISDSSLITPGRRSMSEMANVSRFLRSKNAPSESVADEKVRMMWLPIARRTVQWFAGRERGGEVISENDHNRADSNV